MGLERGQSQRNRAWSMCTTRARHRHVVPPAGKDVQHEQQPRYEQQRDDQENRLDSHRVGRVRSFEPGEDWFYSFPDDAYIEGAELTPPNSHPLHQPVPGPAGKVPPNWRQQLRQSQ